MNQLDIRPTNFTPLVKVDAGLCQIKGKSLPEDAKAFYGGIINWFQEHSAQLKENFTVQINLIYLNSSSSKQLLKLFYLLEDIVEKGKKIQVLWESSPTDTLIQDKGEEFRDLLDLNFIIKSI